MKTTILNQKETSLTFGSQTNIDVPNYVRIDCIQLYVSCGINMLNKSISITFYGENGETLTIPKVNLSILHNLLVDTEPSVLNGDRWPVKNIKIEPLQDDNWPIFIGINSLNLP